MNALPLLIEPDADDPDGALLLVDGTIAGRPYRFVLDSGAARTDIVADDYLASLAVSGEYVASGALGSRTQQLVSVRDVVIGPMTASALDIARTKPGPGARNLLGMDLLRRYSCHFRPAAAVLDLARPPGFQPRHEIRSGRRGHVYLSVGWPGATANANWDTGASMTIVDSGFWHRHPELFTELTAAAGSDFTGAQIETPVLLMRGPVIGQRAFAAHKAVALDLSFVNSTTSDRPIDLILGYPTICQADWLFDFPAGRWDFTS